MANKHEVVISGVSGIFPECDSVEELAAKLFEGVDLVTKDDRRWKSGEMGVPSWTGKLKNPGEFDTTLFGIPRKLAEITDPNTRLSIMQGFRAVCDAGINPEDLSGSNTAVFMSSFTSETEDEYLTQNANLGTYGILANSRAMQANRLSFFLNLKGPSNVIDANWCGGAQAIQCAYDLISTGAVDAAIVGSSSLIFQPEVSVHYQGLGRLSQDGKTRCFSSDAAGYARSEACVSLFLQRAEDAKRSYGKILAVSTTHRGSRPNHFTDFDEESYQQFLKGVYFKANVRPQDVAYYEAAGVGCRTVDAKELNAVSNVFLEDRKSPLKIGCVKSNLGHAEGASNMVSLVKALIALDRGMSPPNLNYNYPNDGIPSLLTGNLEVVSTPKPLEGDLVAVSDFGVSYSTVSHIILRRNPKSKLQPTCPDTLPRLVLLSDRNEANLKTNMRQLQETPVHEEFCSIVNSLNKRGIKGHLYRGYAVLNGSKNPFNKIEHFSTSKKSGRAPVWFMFSGMGSQWPGMGRSLMRLPIFRKSIEQCHKILLQKNIDLINILTNNDEEIFECILSCFVGIAAVQIALVDVLRQIGVQPDGMIGHSVGELGCGYADGCLTLEQMILSAYARGKASLEATLEPGNMAAIGMGYKQIKTRLPSSIDVACHNSATSCTLSGPIQDIDDFTKELKKEGIFAKTVNVANVAYHSRYIKPAGPLLLSYLKPIFKTSKKRSSKWVSTSIPESEWGSELSEFCSAEYYTNNLLSSVLFEESAVHIPPDAILIEIAPHGLLQAIVRRSHPSVTHISLTSRFEEDNLMFLLGALGQLFTNGVSMKIDEIFPKVEFPVPRGTPGLSSFFGWQNTENFKFEINRRHVRENSWRDLTISTRDKKYAKLADHRVHGKVVLPFSFYLYKMANLFMKVKRKPNAAVDFSGVKFKNHVEIEDGSSCGVNLQLQQGSGLFCVTEGSDGSPLCSGLIKTSDAPKPDVLHTFLRKNDINRTVFNRSEVLELMDSYGLSLEREFANVEKIVLGDSFVEAEVRFDGSVMLLLHSLFTAVSFFKTLQHCILHLISEIELLTVDFSLLNSMKSCTLDVLYDDTTRVLTCTGVGILLPQTREFPMSFFLQNPTFEVSKFVSYFEENSVSEIEAVDICSQFVLENSLQLFDTTTNIPTVVFGLSPFLEALKQLSKTRPQFTLTSIFSEKNLLDLAKSTASKDVVWVVTAEVLSKDFMDSLIMLKKKLFVFMPSTKGDTNVDKMEIFAFKTPLGNHSLYRINRRKTKNIYAKVSVKSDYVAALESHLRGAHEKNTKYPEADWVVCCLGEIDCESQLLRVLEKTRDLPHQDLLRFVFSSDQCSYDNIDESILQKDLKICVNFNGDLGSIRSLQWTPTSPPPNDFVFNWADVMSTDKSALGINSLDLTGPTNQNSIGVIEYANSRTMGLGTYNAVTKSFDEDDTFKWDKPREMSPKDAVTIPLLYAMATHILLYTNVELGYESVLVTRGMLPLSQAILSVVDDDVDVYVTANGPQERDNLLKSFPKLKKNHIFDSSSSFYINVLRETNGKGVSKVINTFEEDEMVKPCVQCVGDLGVYIHVSLSPMIEKSMMGMSVFNKELVAIGITAQSLMDLPTDTKIIIRNFVEKYVNMKIAKPLQVKEIPSDYTNVETIPLLNFCGNKVVVSDYGMSRSSFLSFYNNVVVVDNSKVETSSWIDLLIWLLSRGARKVNLLTNFHDLKRKNAVKLQSISSKYPNLNLSIIPKTGASIRDQTSANTIDAVFVLSSGNNEIVENIDKNLNQSKSNCALICLGYGGETVCENRRSKGLLSLCVRSPPGSNSLKIAINSLDALIKKAPENPVITLRSPSNNSIILQKCLKPFIPQTLSELHQMSHSSKKTSIVEVQSSSPKRQFNKETNPLFIFPGLQPHRTMKICSQIFCPVFEVRVAKDAMDLHLVAQDISQQLASFKQSRFTFVGEDWGEMLALLAASQLEAAGKIVRVVLVGVGLTTTVKWAAELLNDPLVLVKHYCPYEVKYDLQNAVTWDEVKAMLSSSQQPHTIECLELLRRRLKSVVNCRPPARRIQSTCFKLQYDSAASVDQGATKEYLANDPVLRTITADTEEELHSKLADEINSLALHEIEDPSVVLDQFLKVGFIKGRTKTVS